MDTYDRYTVFSSIDRQGRYAYGNQPTIGQWNLTQFAITLLPLLHDEEEQAVELAQDALAKYDSLYEYYYITGMREKLGLQDRKSTRLNSSHVAISYAVFCLKKKNIR